mmetsp:Transcript_69364/g.203065  ORF Transcript_69364/g.203065 Transcript_69364/m.203065 type:complete len:209 (-) Transcript_69364:191-817(-)
MCSKGQGLGTRIRRLHVSAEEQHLQGLARASTCIHVAFIHKPSPEWGGTGRVWRFCQPRRDCGSIEGTCAEAESRSFDCRSGRSAARRGCADQERGRGHSRLAFEAQYYHAPLTQLWFQKLQRSLEMPTQCAVLRTQIRPEALWPELAAVGLLHVIRTLACAYPAARLTTEYLLRERFHPKLPLSLRKLEKCTALQRVVENVGYQLLL